MSVYHLTIPQNNKISHHSLDSNNNFSTTVTLCYHCYKIPAVVERFYFLF